MITTVFHSSSHVYIINTNRVKIMKWMRHSSMQVNWMIVCVVGNFHECSLREEAEFKTCLLKQNMGS